VKVSIIMPIYNESPTFEQVLARVRAADMPRGCEKEIVVIDDGSTDGTAEILKNHAGAIVTHRCARNSGKGTAIRIGIEQLTGDIAVIQDGDLEYDPDDYLRILQPIVDGEADVVYGSRFLGQTPSMAARNLLANRILTRAANLLYGAGITDEATAYKAFRTSILRSIPLKCRRFEFCPEVTAKICRLGHRIHEVPISYHARGIADGKKIRARDGLEALWTLIRHRFS
jgi:dolichol-phosphate mannosyltransferase